MFIDLIGLNKMSLFQLDKKKNHKWIKFKKKSDQNNKDEVFFFKIEQIIYSQSMKHGRTKWGKKRI